MAGDDSAELTREIFLFGLPLGSQGDHLRQLSLPIVEFDGVAQTDADGVGVAKRPRRNWSSGYAIFPRFL